MTTYKTAEVAAIIGIHPNTVRLYEKLELIPKPRRLSNGYRVFTEFHIKQCKLIRLAFQVEVLQNGLRKKIVQMLKVSASGDFDRAITHTKNYLKQIIRSLRCANYSLEAVLRLLQQLSQNPHTDIRAALNTPKQTDDIISVCDRLIGSLSTAEKNAGTILDMLRDMKGQFS